VARAKTTVLSIIIDYMIRFLPKLIATDLATNNTLQEGLLSLILPLVPQSLCVNKQEECLNILSDSLGTSPKQLYLVDSGRTAMVLALKALGLQDSAEVLIQAFSCMVVPNAVLQAGYTPIVIDIDLEDYNLSLADAATKITSNTKAIIIQHTFGVPNNMEQVMAFCQRYSLLLIEDCAHAYGVKYTYNGETYSAGSLGEIAIYSFARDKTISTTIGGLIRVNNTLYNIPIQELYSALPNMSYGRQVKSLWYIALCRLLVRPWYYVFNIGKVLLYISQKLNLVEKYYQPFEETLTSKVYASSKYGLLLAPILTSQLNNLPKLTQRKQESLQIVYSIFGQPQPSQNGFRATINLTKIPGYQATMYIPIIKRLNTIGVLPSTLYNAVFIPARERDYTSIHYSPSVDTPVAFTITDQSIINIGLGYNTSHSDITAIYQSIQDTINTTKDN
jgi:dTDP-4-amino-4,6-dideoxygalactose transaminase